MPNIVTIIAPLDPANVETCRHYLRANAEPAPDFAHGRLACQPLFAFDAVATLHFCSFVILEAEAGFGPRLVFEATFDGPRADVLRALLRAAPQGFHEAFRHCVGYPAAGMATPDLVQEYLVRHDVGADTYFCGYPGRSAAQVKDENAIHSGVVTFLSDRYRAAQQLPGRIAGFLDVIRTEFVRADPQRRWAADAPKLPWEVTSRTAVAIAAGLALVALACGLGAIVAALVPSLRPWALYEIITRSIDVAGRQGADVVDAIAAALPWIGPFIEALRPALPNLAGVTVIWAVVRIAELVLSSLTRDPRDQSFSLSVPLQIAVILRSALLLFMAGSVLVVIITGMEQRPVDPARSALAATATALVALAGMALVLLVLQHFADSLKLAVALTPFKARRERLRRAALDAIRYLMVLTCAIGLLVAARQTPLALSHAVADNLRALFAIGFVAMIYAVLGILAAYAVGVAVFLWIRVSEVRDTGTFAHADGLIARAQINARKYTREEGGTNVYQNHLASLTYVKPGVLRRSLVWLALHAVNLLARFWFNRGELGGIPTILSARWVLIDNGRRLLFLDNFGGSWESYLNEFIDLAAVKGLNAIWCNTFVHAAGQRFGFPPTRFFFWRGAQAEQPFKAYVRQSQVETLVWYSAFPTLSVVNVNANTSLRQSLSQDLTASEIDGVFQRL
ncbi:hypothetical protein JQ557_15205 [Bradyrhizobium sp. U87765 SZCCT0131]|uniref:hypothetical protein n=1 Tax=unclassified Bradyrhizobium TaxID=2631580 RepID=UPI001BAAAF5E|nr:MULTISPECIES: hypothetical protein [unclassified Bradyrhizobium]MBR1219349.1 hypothetical protein [Bradyrhizobium sp. U87765 SZCCT0131]MBR1262000.1 hypothetical protein [Bradyrhizobium sp. U87765 SZCCT0134]MBR1306147.1 hypothetical protein [Bradyrhizobium sp. U87765 SZCCT0110]MBR1317782.1 hypothetical protein [Bradyrhizobium sp. U87765 SZCCT0109]MBR1351484.1 hypothetical protein [Bradyrhizobium sp. U87765 SZCCT0048]